MPGRNAVWAGLGFHPTPKSFVRKFAEVVVADYCCRHHRGPVRILDACAGDGRLGHAVARRLVARGYGVELVFVEADPRIAASIRKGSSYQTDVLVGNLLAQDFNDGFDLVVSNPPYQALTRAAAMYLGLEWKAVMRGGRNLYGICLLANLGFCRPGGMLALLAPHGWVTNVFAGSLRANVGKLVDRVQIHAYSNRKLFPGVVQDISVQILNIRSHSEAGDSTDLSITYDGDESYVMKLNSSESKSQHEAVVRVGGLVWNRELESLTSRGKIPVIYGGNIVNGSLDFSLPKYRSRQYLRVRDSREIFIIKSPFVVIKRSMRGGPGKWKLDLAVVTESGVAFAAENHTITVRLPKLSLSTLKSFSEQLRELIELEHRHFGHANLSVAAVQRVVQSVESQIKEVTKKG